MQANTSHSLLDRLQSRNTAGDWNTFVEIYRPFIRRQLIRRDISTTDADDICQETLTQIFKGIPAFQHNGRAGAFRAWLKKIVNQKIWHHARNRPATGATNRSGPGVDEIAVSPSRDDWDHEHDQHVVNRLLQLIKKEFTETSWTSFRRVVIEGEDPRTVASALSVSVNSVLIAKSRIMKRLREIGKGLIDQI